MVPPNCEKSVASKPSRRSALRFTLSALEVTARGAPAPEMARLPSTCALPATCRRALGVMVPRPVKPLAASTYQSLPMGYRLPRVGTLEAGIQLAGKAWSQIPIEQTGLKPGGATTPPVPPTPIPPPVPGPGPLVPPLPEPWPSVPRVPSAPWMACVARSADSVAGSSLLPSYWKGPVLRNSRAPSARASSSSCSPSLSMSSHWAEIEGLAPLRPLLSVTSSKLKPPLLRSRRPDPTRYRSGAPSLSISCHRAALEPA